MTAKNRAHRSTTAPWIDEFRRQLNALFGGPVQGPALHLTAFDRLDDGLARNSLTRDEVLAELRHGIVNVSFIEIDQRGHRRYRLSTHKLEAKLHAEPWLSGRSRQLAVLDYVRVQRTTSRSEWHVPTVPSIVTLNSPRDGVSCDLEKLAEHVKERRWLAEAERTLTRLTLTPRRHTELRDEVRRRYGSLRALLELAKQRAEIGDTVSSAGTVLDGRTWFTQGHPLAGELVVRLDNTVGFPSEEGCKLAVWRDGDDPSKAPRLALAELIDDVVVLMMPAPPDWAAQLHRRLTPESQVVVSETGDFRYKRHLFALRDFLDNEEKVVGNWTSLATMLCQPADLAAPVELPVITPARRPLNPEQCRAVAGALAAAHGFYVQGPPGTGKTQVITELVGRLTARGERVLLTAPTHVAVDEVLRRLANEPGVLPLRLSWKDSLVDDAVRQFTKSGYQAMTARNVRIPATSKTVRWQARLDDVKAERAALLEWQTVSAEHLAAQQKLTMVNAVKVDGDSRRRERHGELDREMNLVRRHAASWAAELSQLQREQGALSTRPAALAAQHSPLTRLLEQIGLGATGRMQRAQRRLEGKRLKAGVRYLDAAQRYDKQVKQHDDTMAALAAEKRRDDGQVADAKRTLALVVPRLEQAHTGLIRHGADNLQDDPGTLSLRLIGLKTEQDELAALLEVQHRWFELLGLTGRDETADRERAQQVVGRVLFSAVNLVCSTTTGFGGDPDYRDLDYDTLIVDEASKVTGAEFLIPARRARRWILVGDEKQLRPYVEPKDEHHIHAMAAIHLAERDPRYTLADAVDHLAALWREQEDTELHPFRITSVRKTADLLLKNQTWARAHQALYAKQIRHISPLGPDPERRLLQAMHAHLVTSLFERCVTAVGDDLRCRLIEQRRMPAEIAELVRIPVYGGEYRTPSPPGPDGPRPLISRSFPTPVVFLDTSAQPNPWDQEQGTGFVNELEAEWVLGVCRQWERELHSLNEAGRVSVSVLAFYSAQAKLIRNKLRHPRYPGFARLDFRVVDSVDRIQGQESDLVIISFCRTHRMPPDRPLRAGHARWLQNINRLNVACTRAKRSLVLVGHRHTLRRLNGVSDAEAFFANLFSLPEHGGVTMRSDWAPPPPSRGGRR